MLETYFVAPKLVHLLSSPIDSQLTKVGDDYVLHLSSKVLTRSVYASFGNLEVKLSDNYVDLIPGEAREIRITSKASLDDLHTNLKIMSLVDAFAPEDEVKAAISAH